MKEVRLEVDREGTGRERKSGQKEPPSKHIWTVCSSQWEPRWLIGGLETSPLPVHRQTPLPDPSRTLMMRAGAVLGSSTFT